jgi:hypothetical protein
VLYEEIKWPGVKVTTNVHLVLRSRIVELYLHCSIRFLGEALIMHRGNLALLLPLFYTSSNHLCGLVVRVLDYRSRGPGLIPGALRFFSEK